MTEAELPKVRKELAGLRQQLFNAAQRNEALTKTLRQARDELERIRAEANALTEPPNSYATVVQAVPGENLRCDVHYAGRKMRVGSARGGCR